MMLIKEETIEGYAGSVIFKTILENKACWLKYIGKHRRAEKCVITGCIDDCALLEAPDGRILPVSERFLRDCPIDFMGL